MAVLCVLFFLLLFKIMYLCEIFAWALKNNNNNGASTQLHGNAEEEK